MNVWLVFILAGLITFLTRLSFIYLFGRMAVPPAFHHALRYVPPAVLTAIIIPEMVMRSGRLDISLTNVRLLAGVLAALVAWRTKNILLTLAVGMASLWILQMFLK